MKTVIANDSSCYRRSGCTNGPLGRPLEAERIEQGRDAGFGDVEGARGLFPAQPTSVERMASERRTGAPCKVETPFAPIDARTADGTARMTCVELDLEIVEEARARRR